MLTGLAHELNHRGQTVCLPQDAIMIACYPPGAFYKRHLDSFGPEDSPRWFTALLYTNTCWKDGDGGELQVFLKGKRGPATKIQPLAGRLVLFKSREVWHEVLRSRTERFAITCWIWKS